VQLSFQCHLSQLILSAINFGVILAFDHDIFMHLPFNVIFCLNLLAGPEYYYQ